MNNNTVITLVVTLIIAGGGGYILGKNAGENVTDTKQLEDSMKMMRDQSVNIRKMGEMMNTSGRIMQEMGMKYKDEALTGAGKDLEMTGTKYVREDVEASSGTDAMNHMMGN